MRKCVVCGKEFPILKREVYVARDDEKAGVLPALQREEATWYDAIDCPHCGCQNILQKRKKDADIYDVNDDSDWDCEGCKHEDKPLNTIPCRICRRLTDENSVDFYEKNEDRVRVVFVDRERDRHCNGCIHWNSPLPTEDPCRWCSRAHTDCYEPEQEQPSCFDCKYEDVPAHDVPCVGCSNVHPPFEPEEKRQKRNCYFEERRLP